MIWFNRIWRGRLLVPVGRVLYTRNNNNKKKGSRMSMQQFPLGYYTPPLRARWAPLLPTTRFAVNGQCILLLLLLYYFWCLQRERVRDERGRRVVAAKVDGKRKYVMQSLSIYRHHRHWQLILYYYYICVYTLWHLRASSSPLPTPCSSLFPAPIIL